MNNIAAFGVQASTSVHGARLHHVACQTDPPKMRTHGTQLSMKTLRPHYKSTGLFTLS